MRDKDFLSVSQEIWNRNYKVFHKGLVVGDRCWEWNRYLQEDGYGIFGWKWTNGRGGTSTELAHRMSWILHNKKNVPEGLYVLHKCDNPRCVNPEHLYIGTQKDNMEDMISRGRSYNHYGENSPSVKLTLDDVNKIRESTEKNVRLAEKYGVTPTAISSIRHWRSWANPDESLSDGRGKDKEKGERRSAEYRIGEYLRKNSDGHWHWGNHATKDIRICIDGRVETVARFLYKRFIDASLTDRDKLARMCDDEMCVNPAHRIARLDTREGLVENLLV